MKKRNFIKFSISINFLGRKYKKQELFQETSKQLINISVEKQNFDRKNKKKVGLCPSPSIIRGFTKPRTTRYIFAYGKAKRLDTRPKGENIEKLSGY